MRIWTMMLPAALAVAAFGQNATQLEGKVAEVTGAKVRITLTSEFVPAVGDRVEISGERVPPLSFQGSFNACHSSLRSFITSAVAGLWSG